MRNKSKKTKKLSIICVCYLIITVILSTTLFVSASSDDVWYWYNFSNHSASTVAQLKENSTSCYMDYQTGTITYIARAYGKFNQDDNCSYDCSHGYAYLFTDEREERYMYNYVLEDGYSYATIVSTSTSTGSAYGVWSPDSVYQSGVLPASDYIQ